MSKPSDALFPDREQNAIDKAAAELAKQSLTTPALSGTESELTRRVLAQITDPQPDVVVTPPPPVTPGFGVKDSGNPYQPDIDVKPPHSSTDQQQPASQFVRPATNADLSKLTESDILGLDWISAKSFDVPAMLDLRPKDGSIRFRWVNFKNYEGGNLAMFKAIGFVNALPEDCIGPVSEHLLRSEDGTIKWFDVLLMKISVLTLMGIYKHNMIRSLQMVGRWQTQAIEQAKRTVENEVGSDIWRALAKQGKRVEFYAPSNAEMGAQDETYKGA